MRRAAYLLLIGLGSCATPDLLIRHPLRVGAVDRNRAVKTHGFSESTYGLPTGTLADEASLLELTGDRMCFGVTLHELESIDLGASGRVVATASGRVQFTQPRAWPDPSSAVTHRGLVAERYYAGHMTVCSFWGRYGCLAWSSVPQYATRRVPGPVTVFQTTGRYCFDTAGRVTPQTRYVTLEVKVDRLGNLFSKSVAFTWELFVPER